MQHEMWLGDLGVLLNFFSSYKQFLTTLSLLAEKKIKIQVFSLFQENFRDQ